MPESSDETSTWVVGWTVPVAVTRTVRAAAAARADMDEKTARKYRDLGGIPGRQPRTYRTRKDPFEAVWPEIEKLLAASPGLEGVTIFETLRLREDVSFSDGQLRTLQRRIRRWRASRGPEKEVMFPQEHRPGEAMQTEGIEERIDAFAVRMLDALRKES